MSPGAVVAVAVLVGSSPAPCHPGVRIIAAAETALPARAERRGVNTRDASTPRAPPEDLRPAAGVTAP